MINTDNLQWLPLPRNYTTELKQLHFTPIKDKDYHPLQPQKPGEAKNSFDSPVKAASAKPAPAFVDPLTSFLDPLSEHLDHPLMSDYEPTPLAGLGRAASVPPGAAILGSVEEDVPGWESKKAGIWSKYTTNESISVPSFVSGVGPKPGSAPVDRVKNRLEQLDQDEEDDGEMLQLTQKEYQRHIEKKRDELIKAWDKEKRVKALKTAIKCAKLLGETEKVTMFYPSKFVLITEILDTFGELVFDRIKKRSTIYDDDIAIPLKDNFRAEDVADHAKETCKNWFFKIASIRELLPRIYVEMAIIHSYRFIENDTFPKIFNRLARMIRGIGDPLVAQYARCYLARKGREIVRLQKDFLLTSYEDYMFTEKTFGSEKMLAHIESRKLDGKQYLDLFCPALDWTLECLGYKADAKILDSVLKTYADCTNGFVLQAIITAFPPALVARNGIEFVKLIKKASDDTTGKLPLYRALGVSLAESKPKEEHKIKIFNKIWTDVTKETSLTKYMDLAEVFVGYTLAHLSFKHTDGLLKDILEHMKEEKHYFDYQKQLQAIMQKILSHSKADFNSIFSMKNFLPFLDLFRGETQTEVNKSLLTTFNKTAGSTSDSIIINTMFTVAKTVHDSITALSFDDDKREISQLLCTFIQKLDFGKDLEKHLNFYVEARRAFINLDGVKVELVKGVCHLAVRTNIIVKGKHNKQSSAFVRACIAYCFITIPSIELLFERLYLFTFAAGISMMNQSIPQAESLLKSAVQLVQEFPKNIEERDGKATSTAADLVLYLKYFLSFLVSVPGHPDNGPFYLLKGFKTVVKEYDWEAKGTQRITIYTSTLQFLAALYQKKQPYGWDKIESNLILFGNTISYLNSFHEEINQFLTLLKEEFTRLMEYADGLSRQAQYTVALELLQVSIAHATVTPAFVTFALEYFKIAKKLAAPQALLLQPLEVARRKAALAPEAEQPLYQKLIKVLEDSK